MSDKPEADAKPKKKGKGMLVKLIGGLTLIAAGGGGAFGAMQAGLIGGGKHDKEDTNPKLVRKGEEDPYALASKEKGEEGGAGEVHGDGGSEYRTIYFNFSEDFTSNLRDSDALVQVSLAASTRRDGRVVMWMKKHELAIRSALIAVLADTSEAEIISLSGKEDLQKRLAAAINKVLTEREGFGGVDAVYFKSFIIQ